MVAGAVVLATVALFLGLGVWQVERRAWKLDLIARVEARLAAEPVPAPGPEAWSRLDRATDEYLRVEATGRFLHEAETAVLAVTERGRGYWILTPLATRDATILVNRGFVPPENRDPATRPDGQPPGEVHVAGLLRLTEPRGGFLRDNDPAADRWFSRDVAAIAAARGVRGAAPYFIDADGTPNPGGLPVGGLTVVRFRNTHLSYALTWFALAGGLAVLTIRALRRHAD
ncbi:MAG: SURF1 family protein [Amaricoccus sp.]|nr:SURF1 family protein [Amaricoccus sp.]